MVRPPIVRPVQCRGPGFMCRPVSCFASVPEREHARDCAPRSDGSHSSCIATSYSRRHVRRVNQPARDSGSAEHHVLCSGAPEIGRPLGADGICQRALGLSPWSPLDPLAPAFITFPLATALATMTTTASGTANLDFDFQAPTILAGTSFDVMFRLVDNETAPTLDLRSGCFTVLVK